MNTEDLNRDKLIEFNTGIIDEYIRSNHIDKLTSVRDMPLDKIDENFEKIKIDFKTGTNHLLEHTGSVYYAPRVINAGRNVAHSELIHFLNQINKNQVLIEEDTNLDDLKPNNIYEKFDTQCEPIILSHPIYHQLYKKSGWEHVFNFSNGNKRFHDIPWYTCSKSFIKDNILILDKSSLYWFYAIFENGYTEKNERINVMITPNPRDTDVSIYSQILFKVYQDKENPIYKIKIT